MTNPTVKVRADELRPGDVLVFGGRARCRVLASQPHGDRWRLSYAVPHAPLGASDIVCNPGDPHQRLPEPPPWEASDLVPGYVVRELLAAVQSRFEEYVPTSRTDPDPATVRARRAERLQAAIEAAKAAATYREDLP